MEECLATDWTSMAMQLALSEHSYPPSRSSEDPPTHTHIHTRALRLLYSQDELTLAEDEVGSQVTFGVFCRSTMTMTHPGDTLLQPGSVSFPVRLCSLP